MKVRSWLATAAMTVAAPFMLLQACANENHGAAQTRGPAGTTGSGVSAVCLLNDCRSDAECGACQDGRNKCSAGEHRCVACDPKSGSGCAANQDCSPYGVCVPKGQSCATDSHGEPQIKCSADADCKACDPEHQLCASGKCVACTAQNDKSCAAADRCVNNRCQPNCPQSCTIDGECASCGAADHPVHACNAHKCSECSASVPCGANESCQDGRCVPVCGLAAEPGACLSDADCAACGDGSSDQVCNKAINAMGPSDKGTCAPKAAGCSDIGQSVAVLPAPWSNATNLCSNDGDCSGVGIQLNVGKLIRDAIGSDKIDLGIAKVTIHDADVSYAMNACASVQLNDNVSCGVCVPCRADSDCQPIALDPLVGDLFQGEPLAQIAGSFLLDLLYGQNQEHDLNMFCQPVAAGYGVCAPCANPAQACGKGLPPDNGGSSSASSSASSGGGAQTCPHDVCTKGDPLACNDACAQKVCFNDSYCCSTAWDDSCIGEANTYCGVGTCAVATTSSSSSSGGGAVSCVHSECNAGDKLDPACSSCAGSVCAQDAYCCNNQWDSKCVGEVAQDCGADFCGAATTSASSASAGSSSSSGSGGAGGAGPGTTVAASSSASGGGGCAHDECMSGAPLDAMCSSCAASVCSKDSFCCDFQWNDTCVAEAKADPSCPACY